MEIADPEGLRASLKEISPMVAKNTEGMRKNGTAGGLATFEALGSLPLQNWKYQGRWEQGAAKIAGPAMTEKMLTGNYFCEKCVIGCGRRVKIDKGPFAPVEGAGPEYETVAMLGSLCLVDDIEAIAKANELCNRYGMDTISCGAAIAFAMEAYEKGLITKKETGELELLWGRGDVMVKMVEKIGKREGLGHLLGEGVRIAAEKIGKNAVEFSLHVKGQEMPAHDPRCFNAGAVGYATINRGACHLAGFTPCLRAGSEHARDRDRQTPAPAGSEGQGRIGGQDAERHGPLRFPEDLQIYHVWGPEDYPHPVLVHHGDRRFRWIWTNF